MVRTKKILHLNKKLFAKKRYKGYGTQRFFKKTILSSFFFKGKEEKEGKEGYREDMLFFFLCLL